MNAVNNIPESAPVTIADRPSTENAMPMTRRRGRETVDLDYHYSLLGSSTCLVSVIFICLRDILVI